MAYGTDTRPAAEVWSVDVHPREKTGKSRFVAACSTAFNFLIAFMGMAGDSVGAPVADVIIRERESHAQVFACPQSTMSEAADMERRLREEMASSTAAEFAESWDLERPSA